MVRQRRGEAEQAAAGCGTEVAMAGSRPAAQVGLPPGMTWRVTIMQVILSWWVAVVQGRGGRETAG